MRAEDALRVPNARQIKLTHYLSSLRFFFHVASVGLALQPRAPR